VIRLDTERVKLGQELDALRAKKNEISASMGKGKPEPSVLEEAKSVKEKIQSLEPEFEKTETEFLSLYKRIPNIPTPDTPV
jgi:seryl-tRNA synthetase